MRARSARLRSSAAAVAVAVAVAVEVAVGVEVVVAVAPARPARTTAAAVHLRPISCRSAAPRTPTLPTPAPVLASDPTPPTTFFNETATPEIYTGYNPPSRHDALPISSRVRL